MRTREKRLSLAVLLVLRGIYLLLSMSFLILIAKTFGATAKADIFFVAQVFPVILGHQIKDALNLSFISTYSQVRVQAGEDQSGRFASLCFYFVLATVTGITLVYDLVIPELLYRYSGLGNLPQVLYIKLIICLSPVIILLSLFGVLESILYSHGCFILTAVAHLFFYGLAILFTLMFTHSLDILAPALGLTLGCLVQFLVALCGIGKRFPLRSLLLPWRGLGVKEPFKLFLKRLLPTLYITSFLQLAFIVQRLLAFYLGEGSVSLITYSTRLTFFLPFLMVSAFVVPSLSSLAVNIAQNRKEAFKTQIKEMTRTIIVLAFPALIWFLFFREGLIRVLLQRGMFSAADTNKLSIVLLFALPGMLPAMFISIYRQSLLVMNRIRQLMGSSTVSIGIGIFLSLMFMSHLGVKGIVLGITLGIFLQFFLLKGFLEEESGSLWNVADGIFILKITFLSALAFILSRVIGSFFSAIWIEGHEVSLFLNFILYMSLYLFGAVKTRTIKLVPILSSLDRLTQTQNK